ETTPELLAQEENKALCKHYERALREHNPTYLNDNVSQDCLLNVREMTEHIDKALPTLAKQIHDEGYGVVAKVKSMSAWRVEGTLREYPRFEPVNLWFSYPIHTVDHDDSLKDLDAEGSQPPWQKNQKTGKKTSKERKKERKEALETAYEASLIDEVVTLESLEVYMGITERTVRNRINEHKGFDIENGE